MPGSTKDTPDDLGAPSNGAPDDHVYDPSSVEVNRGRQQGLGVGAADLARQRDLPAFDVEASAEDEEDEES